MLVLTSACLIDNASDMYVYVYVHEYVCFVRLTIVVLTCACVIDDESACLIDDESACLIDDESACVIDNQNCPETRTKQALVTRRTRHHTHASQHALVTRTDCQSDIHSSYSSDVCLQP